jgi:predicted transposase YdaD
MLGLTDRDLKQTRFYQEVFAEGKQEGRQEGRQEGEVTLVLRLLERRCGVLAPEVKERIAGLSLVQMEALAEALLEFTGPADLEQWVRAHVGPEGRPNRSP